MNEMLSVILGGGAGTRLFPLTRDRSKPAVPMGGKYRLIDIPISNCINSNVDRMFVLTQFNSASLNQHVARAYRFDRFRSGFVTILAAEQTATSTAWFQGTADAVRQVMHHIRSFPHSHLLILSGDQLYRMDYRKLLAFHEEREAEITIASIPVVAEEAPGFGILKTDDRGKITLFREKPPLDQLEGLDSPVPEDLQQSGRQYLASMGIYIFNQDLIGRLLDEHSEATDFGKEIIPAAIDACEVYAYPFDGYWSDLGTIQSFFDANLDLAKPTPPFDLYDPVAPIYTNARMLPPAKIENCDVRQSLIAEGSVVAGSIVENTVIGARTYIEYDCVIRNSVLLGADYIPWHHNRGYQPDAPDRPGIGHGSVIENAIIDKNVRIEAGCRITNNRGINNEDGEFHFIRDGIVVIPKNTVVPAGTVI